MAFHVGLSCFLCLHFLLGSVFAFSSPNAFIDGRVKRATGIPPQGKCLSFKLERPNNQPSIEYVCCNNCGEANGNCFRKTYGSGLLAYCDQCGKNMLNSAQQVSQSFSCGGCDGQLRRARACHARYHSLPAACWLFRACFKHKCEREEESSAYTCFNEFCDANEDVNNCPEDCCQQKNLKSCTLVNGACPLKCCGENTCCEKEDNGGTSLGQKILKWFGIVIGIIVICCLMYATKVWCDCDWNVIVPL